MLGEQGLDLRPELLARFLLRGRAIGRSQSNRAVRPTPVRTASSGAIPEAAGAPWIAHRQQLAVRFQVGPQPVKSLLSPAGPFLAIQLTCVVPLAAAGQGRCARGLVAMATFEVVGRFRVGGQTLGEEAGGGDMALLFVTEMGILVPLVSIRRLRFTPEDGGQPAIELDPPPAFSHPLSRRIPPILASGAQFVPTLQGDESLGILPLFPSAWPRLQ